MPSQAASTTARMFKIEDNNRMVLVINRASVTEVEIEEYRTMLTEMMGKSVIIGKSNISGLLRQKGVVTKWIMKIKQLLTREDRIYDLALSTPFDQCRTKNMVPVLI